MTKNMKFSKTDQAIPNVMLFHSVWRGNIFAEIVFFTIDQKTIKKFSNRFANEIEGFSNQSESGSTNLKN